ncbi:Uma2 family endonuclease [Paenibacillus flagellatus]|uniref:Uma2 family endonuclease n=1 Tax=Paenibacillus flagellatus TaxID=2211139 RepID=A0A2V5JVR6_9BACL|nr:Uma2 family endonuclease [Paenibacillus flagellatus]PYI50809.1 Uma2 family endonuclease [Paenibacillus flagellatus]
MKPEFKPGIVKETGVTYDDYANLPDDGSRYEVADGKLELMSPGPSPRHQAVVVQLLTKLQQSCGSEYVLYVSPIDVILSVTEVRQPDLVMIRRDRLDIVTRRGIEGAPDLVIEVLSPYSGRRDRLHKTRAYARYGIPEYWIADPANRMIEQYVLEGDKYALADVFAADEPVRSERIGCASFKFGDILRGIPDTPAD